MIQLKFCYFMVCFVILAFTKYLNGKLDDNTKYVVFQRSFDNDGDYENEGFIQFTTKGAFLFALLLFFNYFGIRMLGTSYIVRIVRISAIEATLVVLWLGVFRD